MSKTRLPDGRVVDDDEYNRLWDIELKAEALFKADQPTGSFPTWLPQFKPRNPDPIGDHYCKLAAESLRAAQAARTPRGWDHV